MKAPKLPIDGWDALAAAGLLLLGYGLWCIWPPIAYIVVGAALYVGNFTLREALELES